MSLRKELATILIVSFALAFSLSFSTAPPESRNASLNFEEGAKFYDRTRPSPINVLSDVLRISASRGIARFLSLPRDSTAIGQIGLFACRGMRRNSKSPATSGIRHRQSMHVAAFSPRDYRRRSPSSRARIYVYEYTFARRTETRTRVHSRTQSPTKSQPSFDTPFPTSSDVLLTTRNRQNTRTRRRERDDEQQMG